MKPGYYNTQKLAAEAAAMEVCVLLHSYAVPCDEQAFTMLE
jgi:hypothetical protein